MDFSSLTEKAISLRLSLKDAIAACSDEDADTYAPQYETCIENILSFLPESLHELIEKTQFIKDHLLGGSSDNEQNQRYLECILEDMKRLSEE